MGMGCSTVVGKHEKLLLSVHEAEKYELWSSAFAINFFSQNGEIRCDESNVFEVQLNGCTGGLCAPHCQNLVLINSTLNNISV